MERDTIKETIGRRIQAIREERGETQQMLADALGVDRQVVKTWECATRHVKAPDLLALADHYDCTVDYLLGRDENPTRDADMQAMCHYTGLSEETLKKISFDKGCFGYTDLLEAILNDDTMYDVSHTVYEAVKLRDYCKTLPDDFMLDILSGKEKSITPEGMVMISAPDAKELYTKYAADVFRDRLIRFVNEWEIPQSIHDYEAFMREAMIESFKEEEHKQQKELEHGEHR